MLLHVGVSSRRCAILVQFVLGVRKQKAHRSSAIPTKVSVSWEQQSGSEATTTKNDENQATNRNARSNTTAIQLIAPPNPSSLIFASPVHFIGFVAQQLQRRLTPDKKPVPQHRYSVSLTIMKSQDASLFSFFLLLGLRMSIHHRDK